MGELWRRTRTWRAQSIQQDVPHSVGEIDAADRVACRHPYFWSDFDTALAAYTGNALNALTLARFNNDKGVVGLPGPTSKQSLVQFDAAAGIPYSIQIGAATGSEGNISVNAYVFPPGGGISAFLAEFNNNNTWGNRDANCGNAELLVQCSSALFILHNSTNKVLTVTASSKLGAGVAAPAPFQLAAGAVKAVRFTFTAAFNTTTPRTVSGYFTFTRAIERD